MFFVGKTDRKTKLQAGDTVLLHQSFSGGKLQIRIERDGTVLRWDTGKEIETFLGIHSTSELERTMIVMARMLGLGGVQKSEPDSERKKLGWRAFTFI